MTRWRIEAVSDPATVMRTAHLFDGPARARATRDFLAASGHHLLCAYDDDGATLGMISGVEMTHPDKGTEMFVYELSVDEPVRRQGVGTALVNALAALATARGCYGMWVAVDAGNDPALATYRAGGAGDGAPCTVLTWDFTH